MDVMQVGLGAILLFTAALIVLGRTVAGPTPMLHAVAVLGVALTICAVVIGAIRNQQSHPA